MGPLLKFVAKQLFRQKGVIANNKAVNFEAAKLAEKLSEFGIDPSSIKTEKQLEGIINQIKELQKKRMAESMEVISQDDPRFKGIMDKMMGSNVIKRDFGKPFKEEIKKMETEAEIAKRLKAENKKGIESLKQKMAKEKARTQRISGNLRAENSQRVDIGKPKLDQDEYDYYREILGEDGEYDYYPVKGDETKEFLEAMVKEQKDEMAYMKRLYDKGALDPKPGEKNRKKFLDRKAQKGEEMSQAEIEELKKLSEDPEDMADGGRIGFKKGMDRRTFMKIMGGLTALPILGKFFKGAEVAAPVAEKAVEAAKTVPPYFLKLAEQIKLLGRESKGPQERINVYSMKGKDGKSELMLTEDVGTGEMQIKKIGKENDEMVTEVQTMEYTPGKAQADETTKGTPADQYEEYTEYNSRIQKDEFNDPIIEDGIDAEDISKEIKDKFDVEQEILEEVARDKKASGGIAMMLGE